MSQQTPYIGSQISLISRLDIRYEGVLFSVDTKESTITLSKVRSFGTETRPTANPVAPRTEVYEYIIFKATDIKDLIINDNKPKQTPPGQSLAYDPAIISVSSRPQNAPVIDALVSGEVRHGPHLASGRGPQRGGFVQHLPTPGMLEPTGEKLRFETDYDFEKANEQFKETVDGIEKLDLTDKAKGDGPAEKSEAKEVSEEAKKEEQFYDKKSSFFDRISCESIEKQEGKEREMNQETFGSQAVRAFFRRGGTRFGYNGRPHGGYANRYMNNRGGYGQHYYGQQRRGGMAGYRQENPRQ